MRVHQKCIIKGAGFFVGDVEGQAYDNGQIFIEEPFDASKLNIKGFRTVEYKCLSSAVVKPIMHNDFPINADVEMELSATKRGSEIIVHSIKPIGLAHGTPAASKQAA
ncbi:MAG: hypothetical protein ACK4NM_02470 [Hydrogenophaga sp.]